MELAIWRGDVNDVNDQPEAVNLTFSAPQSCGAVAVTAPYAIRHLHGKHVLLIGDDEMRYLALALMYTVRFAGGDGDGDGSDDGWVLAPRKAVDMPWRSYFATVASDLGDDVFRCDCATSDADDAAGASPAYENMYFQDRGVSVTYIQTRFQFSGLHLPAGACVRACVRVCA